MEALNQDIGAGRRVQRAEREVRNLVAEFLLSQLRESLPGIVTVSRVVMPTDLRSAKVYISILAGSDQAVGTPKEQQEQLNFLTPEIQEYVARNLRMKFTPRLKILVDDSFAQQERITRILKESQIPQ